MPFLIDGNNLLGRPSGPASEDDAERRELQRRVASRVRSGGAKAILFFDGEPPAGKREGWL
ncbi:MAG TPA: hypothetical protein VFL12_11175, partial [Thermoanaerobaculia bacterium]|nr:hypothetical protein [Thermoanaerobaculia bacterium]